MSPEDVTDLRDGESDVIIFKLVLTKARYDKLYHLAKYRGVSMKKALTDFIDGCLPGGTGWEHPSKTKPLGDK